MKIFCGIATILTPWNVPVQARSYHYTPEVFLKQFPQIVLGKDVEKWLVPRTFL